eukprot:TRINITY_DN2433_c0_g1_i10.p2 TRINITY_DN2433_c0_g1~~TRINITY_DN2433_c0_g1_i10.p2  ORF type:complete len:176 (+),score=21.24 TRINITY_DN2433_c0_g1_i10:269-796(+)
MAFNTSTSMEAAIQLSVIALKERTGSTMATIIRFIQEHWPHMQPQTLRTVARRMVKEGLLVKVKRLYRIPKRKTRNAVETSPKKNPPRRAATKPLVKAFTAPIEIVRKPGRKLSKRVQSDPETIVIKEEPEEKVSETVKPKVARRRRQRGARRQFRRYQYRPSPTTRGRNKPRCS